MPKAILSINKFEKGILNRYDKRDIPEGGMYALSGVVSDIPGQLRQGGGETAHATLGANSDISGIIHPGYGIFVFNSDYSVSTGFENPTTHIAIQSQNVIGIYDSQAATFIESEISLGSSTYIATPVYHYIDGELKVSDADFTNSNADATDSTKLDSQFVKTFKYIRKVWFYNQTLNIGFGTMVASAEARQFPSSYSGIVSQTENGYNIELRLILNFEE